MIKYIKQKEIPYWCDRKIALDLYWRIKNININQRELCFTIWFMKRLNFIPNTEDEWGY